MTDDI